MRFIEFVITCAAIEATPGPNMSYLVALSISRGRSAALRAVAGVACGLVIIGVLCATGLSTLLDRIPIFEKILQAAGVVFMIWLAIESWRKTERVLEVENENKLNTFWRGLITNLLNPKLFIFYVVLLPEFINEKNGLILGQYLFLIVIYTTIASTIHTFIVLSASWIAPYLYRQTTTRAIGRTMAVLLLGVAGWLMSEIQL